MKNLFILLSICFTLNLNAQEAIFASNVDHTTEAIILVESNLVDLGDIAHNIPATASFTLTNNSNAPMLLKSVKGSCGCTATNYEKNAIEPGQSTVIEATYNAKKKGHFNKTVTVLTNLQDAPIVLKLKGNVLGA